MPRTRETHAERRQDALRRAIADIRGARVLRHRANLARKYKLSGAGIAWLDEQVALRVAAAFAQRKRARLA
jgi:hypothetical protein